MPKKRHEGNCHICGQYGPLSFEHVPPRAAFNDRQVLEVKFDDLIRLGPDERPKGKVKQKGAGGYTLCARCNNLTGKWYAKNFVDWCYQGMDILIRSSGHPTLIYLQYIFPLAIIKQIITMFFSINGPQFAEAHPELVSFVLDRDRKYLSPNYRIFLYYNVVGQTRQVPVAAKANVHSGQVTVLTEITFPPFGYVMTFGDQLLDQRLVDISYFASFDYGQFEVIEIRLPVLPTHLALPGDYRSKDEILNAGDSNENAAEIEVNRQ